MEQQASSFNPKLRFLCSYGGQILQLPPSNSLHYIGGETRFVVVPRSISFPAFFELLSGKLLSGRFFSIKYRLPGCDLNPLITVSNNDDLQNMIAEYDSTRYGRIRLFLFPSVSTQCSVSVNRLLGLESPIQTFSSSVLPLPIFPPNNGHDKVDAIAEGNGHDKVDAPTTSTSLLLPENTTGGARGVVSDKETVKVENQVQSVGSSQPWLVVQEPLQQQRLVPIIYYVPIWSMQPHLVPHPVTAYAMVLS